MICNDVILYNQGRQTFDDYMDKIWKLNQMIFVGLLMSIDLFGRFSFPFQVWRVCWNVTGTVLASSGDDGKVRIWKGEIQIKNGLHPNRHFCLFLFLLQELWIQFLRIMNFDPVFFCTN